MSLSFTLMRQRQSGKNEMNSLFTLAKQRRLGRNEMSSPFTLTKRRHNFKNLKMLNLTTLLAWLPPKMDDESLERS